MKTLHILLLIALVLGATLIGCWTYTEGMYVSTCFAGCAVATVAATFCIKSRRSYDMMEQLLANLRMHDYSLAFHEAATHRDGMWRQADIDALAHDINHVVEQYKQREMEVHTRLRYFETLLGCIDTALIVAKADGTIEWSNRAAEEQLLGYVPRHIDELTKVDATLPEMLREMRPGRSVQLTLHKGTARETRMVADVSIYTTGGRTLHLYALRNIREVLEENEMLSWQKLIRVLTHEIMNSLAPIISLSETLEGCLPGSLEHPAHSEFLEFPENSDCSEYSEKKENSEEIAAAESTAILRQGLQTIHRRSHGLLEFMKNYRKVALVAQPVLAEMNVAQLIGPLMPLFVSTEHITYRYQIAHPDTLLLIDRTQMEQVLINLLKNAAEACAQTPNAVVTLTDSMDSASGYYRLHITDNGPGILPEVQEKVFIPFFTTKPQGSGIGLALSKQIVHLHHGTLRVVSQEGTTCFTLELAAR
ncbi:MAG: GHKL domain-containing protein [Bacteroidaceae bacterium]|nr:GHKL domain-containing protein [Bacteroidaceae bacterium]